MNYRKLLSVVLLFLLLALPALAQDEAAEETDLYAGIPAARMEDGGFVLGFPDAPLTVVEFSDFMCPHCQNYALEIVHPLIETYVATGQVKFEYRMLPIVNPVFSVLAAQIAECAAADDPLLFWYAHDVLFELGRSRSLNETAPAVVAERLELDEAELLACIETADQYVTDSLLADDQRVTGTPGIRVRVGDAEPDVIVVNGEALDRGGVPLEAVEALLEGNPFVTVGLPEPLLLDESNLPDDSLLTGEPCTAPCWGGLTPGETNWEDAADLLEAADLLNFDLLANPEGPERIIYWQSQQDNDCCEAATLDGETVTYIRLWLAPGVTLGEMIEVHGEPAYLTGQRVGRTQAVVFLLFPQISTLLTVYVEGGPDGEIAAESDIVQVSYLSPQQYELLETSNPLFLWDGYLAFRDYMSRDFDLMPQR